MSKENSSLLHEDIAHITQARPISFHYTEMPADSDTILYLHWHSELEFLCIVKGNAYFVIEDQEYFLQAGDGIMIPPNLLHHAKPFNHGECTFFAIVLSPSFLFDSLSGPHGQKYIQPMLQPQQQGIVPLSPSIAWQGSVLQYLSEVYNLSKGPIEQWELQIHGLLLIVCQLLYNHHFSKLSMIKENTRLAEQLGSSLALIHEQYSQELTLALLAEASHLSEGQFCRLFKQLTRYTPFQYLNRYRIMKSCEFLKNTSKNISDIATLCGYNNISYYNREFIRIMSMTPSEYRKVGNNVN